MPKVVTKEDFINPNRYMLHTSQPLPLEVKGALKYSQWKDHLKPIVNIFIHRIYFNAESYLFK
jgi:hypothetical protein